MVVVVFFFVTAVDNQNITDTGIKHRHTYTHSTLYNRTNKHKHTMHADKLIDSKKPLNYLEGLVYCIKW